MKKVFLYLVLAVGCITCKNDIQLRFVVISDTHFNKSALAHENTSKALKNLLQKKPLPDAIFV